MYDVCTNRKIDPQNEVDSDFIVKQFRDGNPRSQVMFNTYLDSIKQRDNYPTTAEPYLTDAATLMAALHCKDPQDVSIVTSPADIAAGKPINYEIDYWKADTNQIFDYVKAQKSLSPNLIKDVNQSFGVAISLEDRGLAQKAFNDRADAEKLPVEVVFDPKGQLILQAKDGKQTARW